MTLAEEQGRELAEGDACRRCLLALPSVALGDRVPRLETVPQNTYAIQVRSPEFEKFIPRGIENSFLIYRPGYH
jgi:hypothetical protein